MTDMTTPQPEPAPEPPARFCEFDDDGLMAIHDVADLPKEERHPDDEAFVERPDRWRVLFGSREDARAWVEWFKTTDLSDDEDPPPCNKILTFPAPLADEEGA